MIDDREERWTKPFWVFKANPESEALSYWCVQWGSWFGAWRSFATFKEAIDYASLLRLDEMGHVLHPLPPKSPRF